MKVKNGVARLTGTVGSESDRLVAAIAARSTPGVRAVQDDLRVEPRRES
jgi:osmotically-inducible protein OsmY